jgi:menaquinone-9 beta-reductase
MTRAEGNPMDDYDVVVVGASIAGCTAARLLALRGAKVALVEKRPALDAYKVTCTHFIQASANPTIEHLGLAPLMEAAGAIRNKADVWLRWGWVKAPDNGRHGWSLRRSTLDPLLRKLTIETPGVEYLPGLTVTGVHGEQRISGVQVRGRDGEQRTLSARLVVGADGRESDVARLARVPARVRPHGRFGYFAYFEDVPLAEPERALFWLSDPDIAYVFPYEQGLTGITVMPSKQRLEEFRGDTQAAVLAHFKTLPDAPDLSHAKRVSKWIGKLEMPNARRPAAARGMAFVGDAAQSSDPIWGVGCGWAFQSAEWLAEELGAALQGSELDIDRALDAYAARHRRELAAHHFILSDYASGRGFTPLEKLLYAGAARDPVIGEWLEDVGSRSVGPFHDFPRILARAAAARLRAVAA